MIEMTPETRSESAALRKRIWDELQGHNPAACADALISLLAHVIVKNARDPAAMAAAVNNNLTLALEDKDDACRSLPN
jgi:hypothetical protein